MEKVIKSEETWFFEFGNPTDLNPSVLAFEISFVIIQKDFYSLGRDEVLKLDPYCRRSFVFWILTTMGRSHARRKNVDPKKGTRKKKCQVAMNFEVAFPLFYNLPGFVLRGWTQTHGMFFLDTEKVKEDRLGSEERVESCWENPSIWCVSSE